MSCSNRPFATNGHMVQNPPCWTASLLLFPHWEIQNKEMSSLTGQSRFVLEAVTFFCVPVWRILYHVIVCCKRPILLFCFYYGAVKFKFAINGHKYVKPFKEWMRSVGKRGFLSQAACQLVLQLFPHHMSADMFSSRSKLRAVPVRAECSIVNHV